MHSCKLELTVSKLIFAEHIFIISEVTETRSRIFASFETKINVKGDVKADTCIIYNIII